MERYEVAHSDSYLFRAILSLFLLPELLLAQRNPVALQPQLIPQPRELQVKAENFRVASDSKIVLLSPVSGEGRVAAQSIEAELEAVTGHRVAIVGSEPSARVPAILLGLLDQPAVREMMDARGIGTAGIRAGSIARRGPWLPGYGNFYTV